jgi:hypothetical protein
LIVRLATVVVAGVVAGLLAFLLLLVVEAERLLLDTDAFVDATAVVVEDDEARRTLTSLLVGQGVERVTCGSAFATLAAESPLGRRAAERLGRELDELLASDRASELWRATARAGHERFVRAARADRPVGEDRLLDLGAMLDRASRVADLFGGGEAPEPGDDGCGGDAGIQVVDADALRSAGEVARLLHVARWLPLALGAGIVLALLVVVLAAGSLRRVGIGIVAASLAALASAFVVRDRVLDGASPLTDGIRDLQVREFAEAVVDAALEPLATHIGWFLLGAGALFLVGGLLALTGGRR